MSTAEHFQAGRLQEAIAAAVEGVKAKPADVSRRWLLAELLCFTGDWARADTHLDAVAQQDPTRAVSAALQRQLIRAEQARQQFYVQGRLPEFLDPIEATPALRLRLDASIRLRGGDRGAAAALLADAEKQRSALRGSCNGKAFDDFRDLDDLTAAFFEVLTPNGKYYWIPMERVALVEFRKPERPSDLMCRRAHVIVRNGPDGEVYLPTLYAGSYLAANDAIRLGRATDWKDGEGVTQGIGQRVFLIGDEDRAIQDIETIEFPSA